MSASIRLSRSLSLLRRAFEAIAAAVLALLSRAELDPVHNTPSPTGDPLELLRVEYPDLGELVTGKSVLDFGCGMGDQVAALTAYGCQMTGLDTNPHAIAVARARHGDIAPFVDRLKDGQTFDVVISQDAMEHYPEPKAVLDAMLEAVRPGGVILITFGPPWFSPRGSHMQHFCPLPWINILFPEPAVMTVRSCYCNDGATRYEEVESGLNKMTLRKFERLLDRPDIRIVSRRYTAVKGLNALTTIPVIRELLTNRVTVVIRKVRP